MDLSEKLTQAKLEGKLPKITVFNRIDGPGSSLDLRLFQQIFWKLKEIPENYHEDPSMLWSKGIPRTVGISIDVGTEIIAEPLEKGKIGVESKDFNFLYEYEKNTVPPIKENWLLRVMEVFNLSGVKFIIKNNNPNLKSAGLGGSAAVTTGVALLANKLTGNKLTPHQIVGMASMMEEDLGVSITGTQEQSCAVFGGVRDYIWFPWGIPGKEGFYGTSIRQELLKPEEYQELRDRIDIYFCLQRQSTDVNQVWMDQLKTPNGMKLHERKLDLAYQFREAIRTKQWENMIEPINQYRDIRTQLCLQYMSDEALEIYLLSKKHNAVCFPLGGGGGSVMVFSPNPENLKAFRKDLNEKFMYIDYNIIPEGHKFENI
jgi:D-glycero-alpha-D-manno-heptose-7-phosphate kinase